MANIFSIAQTGLAAAQAGMATTSHNIANQGVVGYNRQQVIQSSAGAQNYGFGYVGNGTNIDTVQRVYNDFLGAQINGVQSTKSQLDSYYTQISKINNMIADSDSGMTPALSDFFAGIQNLVATPGAAASRQAVLSSGQSLASRFQSLAGQLDNLQSAVNDQISGSITNINSYAQQISELNKSIVRAQATGQPPNDMLDQRDQLIAQLSTESKVTVVKQDGNYNIFIGNGQPLVVGSSLYQLTTVPSSTDLNRLEVGYTNANGTVVTLPEDSLTGGALGGAFKFRTETLDVAQNSLGRIAIGLASTFNDQHKLGQDLNGNPGGDFFSVASPVVNQDVRNTGNASINATITDVGALTTNNYRLSYDGTNYAVTRLPDNASMYSGATFPTAPIDGVTLSMPAGAMAAGDKFDIKPTVNGASNLNVLITDTNLIAAGTPMRTAATASNTGNATISAGAIDKTFTAATVATPVTLTYNSAANTLTGFPATMPVTVTTNGVATTFAAGTPVTYTTGSTISFGGTQFAVTGKPQDGDTFTISSNTNGSGDNRNILALGALQTTKTLLGGTATYNSAYSQIVNTIGNKTREVQVNSAAQGNLLTSIQGAQESESGVNIDEEATNLIRYQQAYQASGKVMQVVSELFDTLISISR